MASVQSIGWLLLEGVQCHCGRGLSLGELSQERCTTCSMREATKTSSILALTSQTSSQSRKMQQPSLRAVLMTYLAFSSRSRGAAPGVTTARLTQPGSTAASRSTYHHGITAVRSAQKHVISSESVCAAQRTSVPGA